MNSLENSLYWNKSLLGELADVEPSTVVGASIVQSSQVAQECTQSGGESFREWAQPQCGHQED